MGCYVNPRSGTKDQWLAAHAVEVSEAKARSHKAGDTLIVALICDGAFTVAPIVVDDGARVMLLADDGREKRFFLASKAELTNDGFM